VRIEFDPYYSVTEKTKKATVTLVQNACEEESTNEHPPVIEAKECWRKTFNKALAHEHEHNTDGLDLHFSQYLDYIFKLAPVNLHSIKPLMHNKSALFFIFQNISESLVQHFNDQAYKEAAFNALIRCAFLFEKKNNQEISYTGEQIDLTVMALQDRFIRLKIKEPPPRPTLFRRLLNRARGIKPAE